MDLLKGEQRGAAHLKRNPLGGVPALEIVDKGKSKFLGESLAIMEWAEENFPKPSLLPGDSFQKGQIRQLSEIVNSGIHPLHNLKVRNFYSKDEKVAQQWSKHWIEEGLQAYENLVKETAGKFSVGDTLTMADLCLIPQCYNAKRYEASFEQFPTIARIYAEAIKTESYKVSAPEAFQP